MTNPEADKWPSNQSGAPWGLRSRPFSPLRKGGYRGVLRVPGPRGSPLPEPGQAIESNIDVPFFPGRAQGAEVALTGATSDDLGSDPHREARPALSTVHDLPRRWSHV